MVPQIQMNQYQTPITEELLNTLPEEVQEQLFDFINNVPFIQSLISPDRKYAKDLPRDDEGKIIVDLEHPHILENMDYFRPSAIHFEKYGCYTNLKPNSNPNSEYYKWIREEIRRCWDGYIRPSDGEWVPGSLYFFMNYSRMLVTKITNRTTKTGERVPAFPEMWEGIYWRFHYRDQARKAGLNCAELASRGKGKSYSLASIMAKCLLLGENADAKTETKSAALSYTREYLIGKDGMLDKFVPMIDFCAEFTEFPRKRLKNSQQEMSWQMGYKDAVLNINRGTLNTAIGVAVKDDIGKIRGKRQTNILIEEFGSFPNLVDMYNIMDPSVHDGDYAFGQIYMLGTAGDKDSDFAGAKEIMYNPKGYKIYALDNVFDKSNIGKPNFVFFFPGYINRKGCYNIDGVSDVIKAMIEILKNRYMVKYNSTDPNTIVKTVAEVPITPSEAILKVGVNLFPITELTERLGQIDSNPKEYDDVYTGDLVYGPDGNIVFKPSGDTPIRDFPHKNNRLEGAIEIYKMPEKNKDGRIFSNRYIAGMDPYDDDASNTMSLGSIFILDIWTDLIVAEYTGRPMFADDFYEKSRKMCLFFNARLNYENNKKGIFAYYSKMNSLYLLTETLTYLKDKDMIKGELYGNKARGTIATLPINNYGKSLIRDWLLKPVVSQRKNEDGEIEEFKQSNLYYLRQRALIKELLSYNEEGNFDRISAMGMLMLLREDRLITFHGEVDKSDSSSKDYLGNDDFFKIYDKKHEQNMKYSKTNRNNY
jgi:hypothetical protein